jgi:hypothetical protein
VRLPRSGLHALPLAGFALGITALGGTQEPPTSLAANPLEACTRICEPIERLACYDQLAGRAQAPSSAPVSGAPPPPTAGVAAPVSAVAPEESFGLHAAEHPKAPPAAATLTARIERLGVSANGRPTVELTGGQLWELDGSDPLLVTGDSVTISRATFGSFLMRTAKGRTLRVRRLR